MKYEKEPELIYLLGLPYSGSTLLALALGNSDEIFNCGEMNYIENDYHSGRVCSCGASVVDCPFWSKMAAELEEKKLRNELVLNLTEKQKLRPLDARRQTVRRRLQMYLGFPLKRIFSESELCDYALRHSSFIKDVARHTGARYIVDASKSPRRLETLLRYSDLSVRVICLHRRLEDAFAGRLKRARRRSKYYQSILSPFYMGQMLHHLGNIKKIRARLRPDRHIDLSYEMFLQNPHTEEHKLSDWLGTSVNFSIDQIGRMELSPQHIITGNIWLTRRHSLEEPIELVPSSGGSDLTKIEHNIFRFADRMLGGISD